MSESNIPHGELKNLCVEILLAEGFGERAAEDIVDVLVEADLRGIPSHGVARLKRYINERNVGNIDLESEPFIVHESPVSAVIDGGAGPGQCVSKFAMGLAIDKARNNLVGLASVRNSNHYGISAYYCEMALKENMVGIAMTNSYPLVVPTFGRRAVLGTNPLSVAFPGDDHPLILDMATSVVTRGKVEVFNRLGEELPSGWAVDEFGRDTTSSERVLGNFKERNPGGILPLGGSGEEFGGHKGYGLALLVELLCAGLSLGTWSALTYQGGSAGVCHFFGALDLRLFGEARTLRTHFQSIVEGVTSSETAVGRDRIYYHGQKEALARETSLEQGVALDQKTRESLRSLAKKWNLIVPEEL